MSTQFTPTVMPITPEAPAVATTAGQAGGFWRGKSAAYLGIPFAAAPVGPHRFGLPAPHQGWTGIRRATTFGPTPQRRPFSPVTIIPEPSFPGEETLNLNVFTPAPGDEGARLPVLVWIHGGGFKAGSPSSAWYDGDTFNRDGVVTVSVSYRLGFDGFGWIEDAPHNRGLRDQIAALAWVRDNITAFGGDPNRVTIAGQSAGGASVMHLLASPSAKGLFQAAIAQSAPQLTNSIQSARIYGTRLAKLADTRCSRAGLSGLTEDQILDLQARVEQELPRPDGLRASILDVLDTGGVRLPFVPYGDGDILPDPADPTRGTRDSTDVPLMMGATAHEFALAAPVFAPVPDDLRLQDTKTAISTALGSMGQAWCENYADIPGGPANLLAQLVTDATFRFPLTAEASSRRGSTWLYDYRYLAAGTGLALHCAELPFVWDHLHAEHVETSTGPNPPQALADAMHSSWVYFIREHAAAWPCWEANKRIAMIFDGEGGSARPAFEHEVKYAQTANEREMPKRL